MGKNIKNARSPPNENTKPFIKGVLPESQDFQTL